MTRSIGAYRRKLTIALLAVVVLTLGFFKFVGIDRNNADKTGWRTTTLTRVSPDLRSACFTGGICASLQLSARNTLPAVGQRVRAYLVYVPTDKTVEAGKGSLAAVAIFLA